MKKIFLLAFGLFFIHLFYIGCCGGCGGFVNSYKKINSINIQEYSNIQSAVTDTIAVQDTLFAIVNFGSEYIAKHQQKNTTYLSAVYATSCECLPSGDLGYKYNIDSLTIKSDKAYAGFAAGENLQSLYKATLTFFDNNYLIKAKYTIPLKAALDSINAHKADPFNILIFNKALPTAEKYHKLRYAVYTNGQEFNFASARTIKFP